MCIRDRCLVGLGLSFNVEDLVKRGAQIMICSPGLEETLEGYDHLVDGDEVWKIEAIQVLRPALQVVLAFVVVVQ